MSFVILSLLNIAIKSKSDSNEKIRPNAVKSSVQVHPEINVKHKQKEQILVSTLKKSKSTENITKKVAFIDDMITFKTTSETDLRKVSLNNIQSNYLHSF